MKKLLLLLLFSTISYSQTQYIGIYVDVKNSITGSMPTGNKPALDLLIIGGVTDKNGITVEIGYERFKAIEFQKYYFGVGYTYTDKLFSVSLIPEITSIGRDWGRSDINNMWYLTIGNSLKCTYYITENIGISLLTNCLLRTDNADRWDIHPPKVFSFYLGLVYKFDNK